MSPKSSGRQLGGSFGYFKYLMTLCVVKHYLEFGKSGFCSSLRIRDRLRRTRFALGVLCPQLGGGRIVRTPLPAPLPAPRGRPRGARTRPGAERRLRGAAAGRGWARAGGVQPRGRENERGPRSGLNPEGETRPGGAVPRPRPRPAARELRRPGLRLLRPALRGASCSRPGPG